MTREELFTVMREIVLKVTDVDVCILNAQRETAPTGQYCSIEPFASLNQIGRGSTKNTEVAAVDGEDFYDVQEDLTVLIEAKVSVNFFRDDARMLAQKLMFCDQRSDIHEKLLINGLGWMRTDAVNNLTLLNGAIYEPRAQINLYIQFEQTQSNTVQQIYNVDFGLQNESGDIITTGNEIISNP